MDVRKIPRSRALMQERASSILLRMSVSHSPSWSVDEPRQTNVSTRLT